MNNFSAVRSDIPKTLQSKEEDTRNDEESQFASKSYAVNFPRSGSPAMITTATILPDPRLAVPPKLRRHPLLTLHAAALPALKGFYRGARLRAAFLRYRPYPPRDGPTSLELRFAARTTGPSSHLTMTMNDVEEVMLTFN